MNKNNTWMWVLGGLIALLLIGSSGGGSERPDGCGFNPDPRGGYYDC